MSSFNQSECLECGQICDGLYCYPCTCQQCGVVLANGICLNCTYGDGKPITCCECEGSLRGGFCLFCDSKAENSFTYDPNPYSFNDSSSNFNHLLQLQYVTYLCELCENDSHYGYDCPPQFSLVYEQEPSYNQSYNDNYYPHNSPSFLCCDYCGGDTNELLQKLLEDLQIISEELAEYINSLSWNRPTFYNNDEEHSIQYKEYLENSSNAITTDLPTKEPEYSLSMRDEHLSTIPEMESDEVIKSSVKNLVQIPSEYEVTSDNESECDVPVKDESSPIFTTFSNPIFDYNDDFTSSDDELFSKEDVPMENFKIYSNPHFDDEEINSNKIDPHYFNAESNLIESLSNRDTLFESSPKFDYLEEFSGELMPTSIINEERIKREHEEYISLMENDSLREEIDIFTGTDDFMPPGIESNDYDSERDIHFLEELLSNDSISLPKNESSNFDYHDDSSFPRPPSEPPDVEIFFEPDSGVLTTNVVKGISEHYVLMPNSLPTLPTFDPLYPVYDTLLLFSSKNEDKVFKPGILSYLLVYHRDITTYDFSENPMMMFGGDIPSKVVPDLHTIPMDK
uniref:Pre-mRNA splicing Prp18-interacting factor n=1 Tax=Tanacetum cinerariifolium TaxID=118510 RepID=A0A6L2MS52_TANCI|nr:hypothetical protein [Tanacetum cinerariifolium]